MASFIIEYIIDFLLGNSPTARMLRENFVFKIVPMLNIDGVIIGNYRCNLSGADLNRQWIEPSKKLHPSIYYTKMVTIQWFSSFVKQKNNDKYRFAAIFMAIIEKKTFSYVKMSLFRWMFRERSFKKIASVLYPYEKQLCSIQL